MTTHIKVLNSGSDGNCYIIQAGEEKVLVECGIDHKRILEGLNYNIRNVKGCLISHKHVDHCKSMKWILKNFPRVCAPSEVFQKFECKNNRKCIEMQHMSNVKLGGFNVTAFNCNHTNSDGTECQNVGYIIRHKLIGNILFATDTYYLKYVFSNINHVLIECNYSENIIQALEKHEQRVFKSHMSLETLKTALKNWDLTNTKDITLVHLSKNNGNPELFKAEIEKLTGIPVYIAESGLEINL